MTQDLSDLPGPQGKLLIGSLLDLSNDPLSFLMQCSQDYGDIIPLRLGLKQNCLVVNPDYIEQVLKDRDLFIKSPGFRALKTLLGEGLLTAEGDSWFWRRRLVQPVFHQRRIQGYGKTMVYYAEQMLQGWHEGETRNIHADMMHLTLQIVMKCIFSTELEGDEAQAVANALTVSMDWFESKRKQNFVVWEWLPRPENVRYHQAIAQMDQAIYSLIRDRRNCADKPDDLLTMLIEAQDEETGQRMDDKLLRDELATLMLAGHETTANALSWTWMLLSQNPQAREKLQTELTQVLEGRLPTVEDIPNLAYTSQVVKESMRLYPPVALVGREASRDCTLGGYKIPKGCTILISQWVMHHHPQYFENPEAFQPERWSDTFEKQLPRGVYIPFGEGPRICVGQGFARMEAILLLAAIAQRVQLDLQPGFVVVPQSSITLRPQNGIKAQLKKLRPTLIQGQLQEPSAIPLK